MNEQKIVVIYHRADFDGIFCREIAKKFLPEHTQFIGWDYGNPEPEVSAEVQLYILDLSVPGLMNHPNLIWIDHHKSAIDQYSPIAGYSIAGYRIDGVAACRLTWQWFRLQNTDQIPPQYHEFKERTVSEPWAVRLAGEYDIWDKRDPNAELFQHGLRSEELTPLTWYHLLEGQNEGLSRELVGILLKQGKVLQYSKTEENKGIVEAYGFTLKWMGLTFLACNHARFNSQLFTAGLKPEHDACLGFNWDGKNNCWRYSLYHAPGKEHLDLSEIARKFGGGGHRGACGFRSNDLIIFQ